MAIRHRSPRRRPPTPAANRRNKAPGRVLDKRGWIAVVAGLVAATAIGLAVGSCAVPSDQPTPSASPVLGARQKVTVAGALVNRLAVPWGVVFVAGGDALVADLAG